MQLNELPQIRMDLSYLSSPITQSSPFHFLIIINSTFDQNILANLLSSTQKVLLIDGGANRLYSSPFRDSAKIDAIIGDFDSIEEEVYKYYSDHGCKMIKDQDQNTNDLQKGFLYLGEKATCYEQMRIGIMGVCGGRIDQQLYNMHMLQRYTQKFKQMSFVSINLSSVLVLIKPYNTYTIKISPKCILNQAGLIAFTRAKVQTEGFKWNIGQKQGIPQLEWGKIISSSNKIEAQTVTITSSEVIFFTIELRSQ